MAEEDEIAEIFKELNLNFNMSMVFLFLISFKKLCNKNYYSLLNLIISVLANLDSYVQVVCETSVCI
jgi:hypothetical protein